MRQTVTRVVDGQMAKTSDGKTYEVSAASPHHVIPGHDPRVMARYRAPSVDR